MTLCSRCGAWFLAVATMAGAASAAFAAERQPLPHFMTASLEGQPVASESLVREGAWLLIHVEADCAPCNALLARMDDDEHAPSAPRIAVVVAADGARTRALGDRFPHLRAARWLADPTAASRAALGLRAVPTVLGLRGASVEWRFAGLSRRPGEMESILSSWLKGRP